MQQGHDAGMNVAETFDPKRNAAPVDRAAEGYSLRSLITAEEMFPDLERLALGAETELLMSFRIFDARTGLRSDEAKELGLATWADLLTHVAERGVKLRILLADFDPIFAGDLHRNAWTSARIFGSRLPDSAELLCALHECRSAPMWKWVFRAAVNKRLRAMRELPPEHLTTLQNRALQGDWDLRPVTLHQKLAVADGRRAIIGGLDVDERRWDTPEHDQRPEETWHDVSLRVEGPPAADIRAHFANCWQRALDDDATRFTEQATPVPDPGKLSRPEPPAPRVIRTVSCRGKGAMQLGAETMLHEHEDAHIAAFARAEHSIYIETQFFRHAPLAEALAEVAARQPRLQLVLLMPTEPDRVIFDGQTGVDSRHAQALQIRCLDILKRAFGDRMMTVSPVQPRKAKNGDPMPLKGGRVVYVHSKVTIVDDHTAIVGSANLNGRSMKWDTEASLMFHDPGEVRDLRERLARIWLDDHYGDGDPDRAATWRRAAEKNAKRAPDERAGFMLPYPEQRNRRFARFLPILPPEMF
ncbi:phospholipase D family protein [Pseudooceanicola sp. LIPI14-2-Ac024]|uniref:phospholipase D family protein n=1 Tax=Pseudooceanicola sp. LIPI14-2-Ac024 TaxID=3344875 RepID=UPI0035CFFC29